MNFLEALKTGRRIRPKNPKHPWLHVCACVDAFITPDGKPWAVDRPELLCEWEVEPESEPEKTVTLTRAEAEKHIRAGFDYDPSNSCVQDTLKRMGFSDEDDK